jgi:hypothetical protein
MIQKMHKLDVSRFEKTSANDETPDTSMTRRQRQFNPQEEDQEEKQNFRDEEEMQGQEQEKQQEEDIAQQIRDSNVIDENVSLLSLLIHPGMSLFHF